MTSNDQQSPVRVQPACSACRWGKPYNRTQPSIWARENRGVECHYNPTVVNKSDDDYCHHFQPPEAGTPNGALSEAAGKETSK